LSLDYAGRLVESHTPAQRGYEIGRVAPESTPVEIAALASVDSSAEVKPRSLKPELRAGESSNA
jgi:hypothetical protein